MFAFFGSNHRHGKPHQETFKRFQSEAYCRMDVYEKLTGRSAWLLGLATLRELLEVVESALAAVAPVAFAPRSVVVIAPRINVLALAPGTLERTIFPSQCMNISLTPFGVEEVVKV